MNTTTAAHEATNCERSGRPQDTLYCGKSWKSRFVCPCCGRETWQNLNFLGRRNVVCDGEKFTKQDR